MPTIDGLRLPAVFSDHMVLQRDIAAPVWGWAAPGEKVAVTVAGQTAETTAGRDGKWLLRLAPLAAGGPHEVTIRCVARTRTLHDVLVGDVWICSGQSNMEFSLRLADGGMAEAAAAQFPRLRHMAVPRVAARDPQDDVDAAWVVCEPATAGDFTAVGYFFARKIQTDLGVPIGLLHTSWGGSNCETWCSREALQAVPSLRYMPERLDALATKGSGLAADLERQLAEWDAQISHVDPGIAPHARGWEAPDCDLADWQTMDVPRAWESIPGMGIDGAVWFRKEIQIPAAWAGRPLTLSLGAIDDFDTTYCNGVKVGATAMETPNWWSVARRYTVPANLVKAGPMVIAVRVFDRMGNGGMVGGGHAMRLAPEGSDAEAIRLDGDWRYRVELALKPKPMLPKPSIPPLPGMMNAPCALYNAMIAPLIPFAVKGAIWYQGESNADRGYEYITLFPTMIRDWRTRWGQGDFPFLWVQLANFMARANDPGDAPWAELRDAQTQTLALPKTGMAVIIDVGDAADIHPRNKRDVGLRLAMAAENVAYGLDVAPSGPLYRAMAAEAGKIRVRFDHVHGGLIGRGERLGGFAIAGADRKFVWADAVVDGETVIVSSPAVPAPVAVRYAWADNPVCSLYNAAGLPASPFRTDDWPWPSQKKA